MDDLNMPQALAVLWKTLESGLSTADKRATVLEFDRVLGLSLADIQAEAIPVAIAKLAAEREEARERKDWTRADHLRAELEQRGYAVRDTEDGPAIEKK